MATSAPSHVGVSDRQGRLTLTQIDDRSVLTLSTTTTSPLTSVSRLMSADAQNDTKVDQVIEVGTNGIVGGVAQLGEFKGKLVRNDVSSKLIGLMTAKKFVSGTQTWTYPDLATAKFDYCRLLAAQDGTVIGAWVALSAELGGAQFDFPNAGIATESYDVMGPQLVRMNAYPISKNYVVQSADVTAGYVPLSGVLGTGEFPIPILPPASGQPPSSLTTTGRCSFLAVHRVPTATATIGGNTYGAGTFVRYYENQPYKVAGAGMGTIGAQTVTPTVLKADGTTMNYVGPELVVGATISVEVTGANYEECVITAVASSTITFTTTKTHSITNCVIGLKPASGYCLFDPSTSKIKFGDTLVLNDVIRVLFGSYDTASTPKTISTSKFDTTDAAGVPGRLLPISIAAYQIPRVQSASIKVGIAKKQVQGCGENEIRYGAAGVPQISYDLSVIPTDNALISVLQTGSSAAGSGGDIYSSDYTARYMLANPANFLVQIKDPSQNNFVMKSYTGGNPVFTSDGESGPATSDLSGKLSGQDFSGTLTITAYK